MYTYCSKWLNLGLQSKNNSRAARAKHKVEISVLGVKMVQLFGARPHVKQTKQSSAPSPLTQQTSAPLAPSNTSAIPRILTTRKPFLSPLSSLPRENISNFYPWSSCCSADWISWKGSVAFGGLDAKGGRLVASWNSP